MKKNLKLEILCQTLFKTISMFRFFSSRQHCFTSSVVIANTIGGGEQHSFYVMTKKVAPSPETIRNPGSYFSYLTVQLHQPADFGNHGSLSLTDVLLKNLSIIHF
jgi:hypothetical protein